MSGKSILRIIPLSFQWETLDPFLFCVHHQDFYPKGNELHGPEASLSGRHIGQDFTLKDGWRMYHGDKVPGFPVHPHRGFETVTIVRTGIVDHSDSLGAAGRYGEGDVQWLTTGKGVQHSEMFPLLHKEKDNPLELFQIWLNLPKENKMVPPHFKMLWRNDIPKVKECDADGKTIEIEVIAGELGETIAPSPTPDSWAANPENQVAIWLIHMESEARWKIPKAKAGLNRTLYFFDGDSVLIQDQDIKTMHGVILASDQDVEVLAGEKNASLLLLQGRPINEPVAQYGPFVMNDEQEIQQAFSDYRQTQFGGWPWPGASPVHGATRGRFAKHADGLEEEPHD